MKTTFKLVAGCREAFVVRWGGMGRVGLDETSVSSCATGCSRHGTCWPMNRVMSRRVNSPKSLGTLHLVECFFLGGGVLVVRESSFHDGCGAVCD